MEFKLPPSVIEIANEISLGELFEITTDEKNVKGIIRIVSYCKGHLMTKPNKTTEEKNLLLDLIDLANEIGTDLFDEAFSTQREYLASKTRAPRLPLPTRTLNPNRRKAELVRLEKRTK
tara:strand:+ start:466 stop:822 length:357 start_codon:yes stop_codon:yes gene_type:complete